MMTVGQRVAPDVVEREGGVAPHIVELSPIEHAVDSRVFDDRAVLFVAKPAVDVAAREGVRESTPASLPSSDRSVARPSHARLPQDPSSRTRRTASALGVIARTGFSGVFAHPARTTTARRTSSSSTRPSPLTSWMPGCDAASFQATVRRIRIRSKKSKRSSCRSRSPK